MTERFIDYLELMSDGSLTQPEIQYIHVNTGINRRERRHGYTKTGKHFIVPAEYREITTNMPYRRGNE